MNVHIINPHKVEIDRALRVELPGVTIKIFANAVEYAEYVFMSAALLDMLIITDSGMVSEDSKVDENFASLKRVFNYDLFTCDTIICLNKTGNEEHKSKYEYLRSFLNLSNRNLEILEKSKVDIETIKQIITRNTAVYKPLVTNKKAVIQIDRNSKAVSSRVIPEASTDNAIAVELNVDTTEQLIKLNNRKNAQKIKVEDESLEEIDELLWEDELSFESLTPTRKHIKYIVTTGLGGSGVSTTALIMAMTGSTEGKTLLIDANPGLGLSYIVEGKIPNSKYLEFSIEDIIAKRDDIMTNYMNLDLKNKDLHIMVSTLPALRSMGEGVIEYIILNLLSLIEDQYKYIVIDLPLSITRQYTTLLDKADVIITSSAPYKHKYIPLLQQIKTSIITKTRAYDRGTFFNFFTGAPDLNRLDTSSIKEFSMFSKKILGKAIRCTRSFPCSDNQYVANDIFRGIVDISEDIVNAEESLEG